MGPVGQTYLIDRFLDPSLIVLQYMFLSPLCSSPRHQRNIPCAKIRNFGTQTSYFPTFEICARDAYQHMYVIRAHFSFDDFNAFLPA